MREVGAIWQSERDSFSAATTALRLPQAGAEEASAGLEAAVRKERMKQRTPRVDFRKVAQEDVRLRRVRRREVWRQA
jgi:hypothetical protein